MQNLSQILKYAKVKDVFLDEDRIALVVVQDGRKYEVVIEYNEEHEKDPVQKPLNISINDLGEVEELKKDKVQRFLEALDRALERADALVNGDMLMQYLLYLEEWEERWYAILVNGLVVEVDKAGDYIRIHSLHNPEG